MQIVSVKVHAGARKEVVKETAPHTLAIHVQTAPEKGKATMRVVELVAEHYDVPVSSVRLVSGRTSKNKKFSIP